MGGGLGMERVESCMCWKGIVVRRIKDGEWVRWRGKNEDGGINMDVVSEVEEIVIVGEDDVVD